MSHKFTKRVAPLQLGSMSAKFVLWALADYANAEGVAYPKVSSLARMCNCSERAVRKAVKRLEDEGLISVQREAGKQSKYTVLAGEHSSPNPCTSFMMNETAGVHEVHTPPAHSSGPLPYTDINHHRTITRTRVREDVFEGDGQGGDGQSVNVEVSAPRTVPFAEPFSEPAALPTSYPSASGDATGAPAVRSKGWTTEDEREILRAMPSKMTGRPRYALREIRQALTRIQGDQDPLPLPREAREDPATWLLSKVKQYAASPKVTSHLAREDQIRFLGTTSNWFGNACYSAPDQWQTRLNAPEKVLYELDAYLTRKQLSQALQDHPSLTDDDWTPAGTGYYRIKIEARRRLGHDR